MAEDKQCKIKIFPIGKEVYAKNGSNLMQVLLDNGIDIESSCGGVGTCGRCKVEIIKGNIEPDKSKPLGLKLKDKKEKNLALSCLSKISGDLEIYIFPTLKKKAKIEGDLFKFKKDSFYSSAELQKIFKSNLDYWILKKKVTIEKPTILYSTSDTYRLIKSIKDEIGIDNINIPLKIIKKIPQLIRESDWEVYVTIDKNTNTLLNIQSLKESEKIYGVAVDVGTTTVVVYLIDLTNGNILLSTSDYNPQIKYGEDIINRIVYSTKNDGLEVLRKVITQMVNSLTLTLTKKADINTEDVAVFMISGNSTMMHLFFGVLPKYIREEPYVTTANDFGINSAKEVGLFSFENAVVYCIEGVASYLGGDIVSGLLTINILKRKKNCLFIDLGTNGELVVGNKDWLIGCACSAGPAFEGGGVDCGVRAIEGAIEKVDIDGKTFKCKYKSIGNTKPIGICGSGLIDLLGDMYLKGIIDRKGKFNKDLRNPFLRTVGDEYRYIIAEKDESGTNSEIYINEVDISNLIRAKAAVYSGIKTLLEELDLKVSDIDKIFIAGGLGKNLNVVNAIVIGMLPDISVKKYMFLGNTSITGAYLSLTSYKNFKLITKIASKITYLELSINMKFMDRYIAGLFLPYTDVKDFPTVEKLLISI